MGTARVAAFVVAPLVILFGAVAGCAEEAAAPTPAAPTEVEVPPETSAVETNGLPFEQCSLESFANDRRAQCVDVDVPLDWNDPNGRRVKFFVKRILGSAAGPHKQLWLLQGGPGGAGDGLETLAREIAPSDPTIDIYLPDHRGTGRSARLDCPKMKKTAKTFDYAACAAEAAKDYGDKGFATFTTTTAARDLGYAIERTKKPGQEVHIYGVSYGTYWAQRYLQIFPRQATAVTLDSLCQSGTCSYNLMGYWFDRVGKKYMAECAADAACHDRLGADPLVAVRRAFEVADAGQCAGLKGVDGEMLRALFHWFISKFELRALIPAVTYRAIRCDAADVAALETFKTVISSMVGIDFRGFAAVRDLSSDVLGFHIGFSELEPNPLPSKAELAKMLEDAVFSTPDPSLRDAYDAWPKYPHDELVGKYPSTEIPVLLMNGTLDPQTPQELAEQIAPHYRATKQRFVLMPRAAHAVIRQSPTNTGIVQSPCGMTLWRAFVNGPEGDLDTSCTARILPHDFGGQPELAGEFFGTATLWGNQPSALHGPVPPPAGSGEASIATSVTYRSMLRDAVRQTPRRPSSDRVMARWASLRSPAP